MTVRVLLTGMSGSGKSTVLGALRDRGWTAVDLDDGYVQLLADGRQAWDEERVDELLSRPIEGDLVVAGCEENMAAFLPRFDLVVLLTAPVHVLISRLQTRTGNDFGKHPGELDRILTDVAEVEPLLRAVAHLEIDTRVSVDEVAERVMAAATPS